MHKDNGHYNIPGLNETRGELLRPPLLGLNVLRVEELRRALRLVASNYDAHAATLEVARGQRTDTAQATRTEVERVRGGLREVGRLGPVDREGEDLIAQGAS